ncbi:calmodulin-binding transcription activator 2-like isoform X2 [Cicer arietinum]|uniref:Calmodulin-binding transcription activator 2-like isoform X2 n=1 Tax=Cicer arietinum TaxID=3827 RepID=A0A1S2X9F5_CICAR|nr:calmodulin-binding transcription activator 2-like isoform X2 [Cicer arietinum]
MAEPPSYGLDMQQLQFEAQHRWLRPAEICEILCNYRMFHITSEPHIRPPSGSLFLFDRKVLRYFRKDGHNWRKKKDGKTVKEAHEKLKVGSVDVLHCYYAHGEENENFQRRSYWMLDPEMMHIVFVHYLEVKGNKSNIGGNSDCSVPSLSTDPMSPTSSLASLREDADSGDHGQSSVSGTDYIPLVDMDKYRGNDATCIDGLKAHDMASWDTVLQSTGELHADPSLVSFPSIPSSSLANILDQEQNIFGDFSMSRSDLTIGAGSSQPLQSNWQIPFEDNTGHMPSLTQSLSLEFGSDYGTGLLGNEAQNESSEIDPVMFSFHGEPKEKLAQQNYLEKKVEGHLQDELKSNCANEVHIEETINYPLSVRRTLLDSNESLKKVDSFSRWITKALGEVDNLNMQSSPGISWSTDECGHVIDDTSLSPSLSQDQLYSINDFSPKWAYAGSDTEVLIIGSFLKSQPEVTTYNWSCMFGEVEVPAEVVANGILCCQAPPHKVGRVPFYVTCSNRLACSEVREFDFREGYSSNVDYTDFFNSSNDMLLHLRLDKFLSLKPVHPSNQAFEGDMEKINLIFKLISLREEEDYSSKEEKTVEMNISRHKVKEHQFHRQFKENLYSWLLHKVTESGKGPNVLDKDGQGVLHLAAVLGYYWAITPILIAGVNVNFRDVNGWTALHWAASCGRERTVAVLVSMGADCGALTDPSPEFPSGRTAADLASSNGHKGISGFLAESSLTSHLESLTVDDKQKGGQQEISGTKAVQTVSERTATPVVYNDMPDGLCLKDSLTAVRNATQAADRIHQVFRMQSFQRKQLTQYEDDEFGLSDQRALSLLASKVCKSGQRDGLVNVAATQIQKKFRGWKKRKEFLIIRERIVKIQAHVRGHQVRKQYKTIIWSVGILEKVILRWRRKGSGLRGFRPDTLNKAPSQQSDSLKEDDYDYLKEGRKQKEEKIEKALSRVKSMVQYPEARAQYRRVLNVVEDFRQKKDSNMGLISSEETVDGVEDLIDIDMLLDDDNFIPIAFD